MNINETMQVFAKPTRRLALLLLTRVGCLPLSQHYPLLGHARKIAALLHLFLAAFAGTGCHSLFPFFQP